MSNKNILFYITAFLFTTAYNPVSGQVSAGGKPVSFGLRLATAIPVVTMPPFNVDSMLADDARNAQLGEKSYRFGYNYLVYYKTDNSGIWTTLRNGDRIWQLEIHTPGSYTVNMGFTDFNLPPGAKLFIYSKDHRQILGGFTSANKTPDKFFGSELIYGDEVILEYYEPATARGQNGFTLFRITHGYKDLLSDMKVGFGTAGTCIPNINCPQFAPYWTQKRAVVMVIEGNAFCSGSLINDCSSDGTPYLLTANHCGVADGQWVFRFNWEAPGCADPASPPSYQSITGATALAQDTLSDFNLIRLDSTPPASFHAFYAGWNRGLAPATSVEVIQHPEADIKKGALADNPVTDTFYNAGNGTAQVWQIGHYTDGVTEPGSSGSPLLDQNKRIIGQLYGGPSDCGVPVDELRDYYGRFNVSWDSGSTPQTRLKDWLDPCNNDSVTNDGYDPYPVNDSLNIALLQIAAPTVTCSGSITPGIWVENTGMEPITSFAVTWQFNNGPVNSFVQNTTISSYDSVYVALPSITGINGQNTLYVNLSAPNGQFDTNLYDDSASSQFIVISSQAQAPLFQGFESGVFPPSGWTITTPPSGTTWETAPYGGFGQSATSASVNEFAPASSTAGETPSLYTPAINMAHVPVPAYLSFDRAYGISVPLYYDTLAVLVSTDCGSTWTTIYKKGGDSLATDTTANSSSVFIPASSQWVKDSVNITDLVGDSSVLFNFEVISGWGDAVYLDNINIGDNAGLIGIIPVPDEISVRVYPNPFTNNFSLQFTMAIAGNIDAALYSVDGKKLVTVFDNQLIDAGTHLTEINTQQLSNGIYFLKVNEQYFKVEKLN